MRVIHITYSKHRLRLTTSAAARRTSATRSFPRLSTTTDTTCWKNSSTVYASRSRNNCLPNRHITQLYQSINGLYSRAHKSWPESYPT